MYVDIHVGLAVKKTAQLQVSHSLLFPIIHFLKIISETTEQRRGSVTCLSRGAERSQLGSDKDYPENDDMLPVSQMIDLLFHCLPFTFHVITPPSSPLKPLHVQRTHPPSGCNTHVVHSENGGWRIKVQVLGGQAVREPGRVCGL